MFWQLDRCFTLQVRNVSESKIIFHHGSGMTHCLSGEAVAIFELFFENPDKAFNDFDIQMDFPEIKQLAHLLANLKAMNLVATARTN